MPCPNRALYNVSADDRALDTCADHITIVIDRVTLPGKTVTVSVLQSARPCQFKTESDSRWDFLTGNPAP